MTYSRTLRVSFVLLVTSLTSLAARAATLPPGFVETRLAAGLDRPTAMTVAPDGRIFVCEEKGRLRVIKDGVLLAKPFVTVKVLAHGERGLLGVVLDPDFESNHFVYVYYIHRAHAGGPQPARKVGTAGNGLTGTYFAKPEFKGATFVRIDPTINFDWKFGAPAPGIGADAWSARWTGEIEAQVSGLHTFFLRSNDGARLWIRASERAAPLVRPRPPASGGAGGATHSRMSATEPMTRKSNP